VSPTKILMFAHKSLSIVLTPLRAGAIPQIQHFARVRARRGVESVRSPVGTAQWILERLRQDDSRQVATLVRWLDEALNNTSVILLVSVGNHRLLFGGDAQIENWGWTLNEIRDDKALRDALGSVDLYKVGHHGSRNGTPKSLYELWSKRMTPQKLVSMMSTKAGVHGLDDCRQNRHLTRARRSVARTQNRVGQILRARGVRSVH